MRDRETPGGDIAERLLELAAAVVRLGEALPKRAIARHIGLQMVRSATSAGATARKRVMPKAVRTSCTR